MIIKALRFLLATFHWHMLEFPVIVVSSRALKPARVTLPTRVLKAQGFEVNITRLFLGSCPA
eukprot:11220279-Lingulodinium_polyedra.AAC.1